MRVVAVDLFASASDEVISLTDICIEYSTEKGTDKSTNGRIIPATVYCPLMACNVDVTTASEYGKTTECGSYDDSTK